MTDCKYHIYTHTSPSGKVYVGQTVNPRRRWGYNGEHYKNKKPDGSYIQEAFARAIDKYGWDSFEHVLVLSNISKQEADYAERYLIKWYKLHNASYNITNGGEGTCGLHRNLSPEEKEAIRQRNLMNPPMKGKHHSEETKKKLSKIFKGRKLSDEHRKQLSAIFKGRKHSEDSKVKMRTYKLAHPETWIGGWNKKEVHQYDINGCYMQSFPSAEAAARSIGKSSCNGICRCINGECTSAFGYIWRTEKVDFIDLSDYKVVKTAHGTRLINMSEEKKNSRKAIHGEPINQYSLDGEYINTYCTAKEAARSTGINYSCIVKCCKHKDRHKTAGGYRWEYRDKSPSQGLQ